MTAVAAYSGDTLLVQIGDGGGPETFATKCMINTTRGYTINAKDNSAEIADCGTPGNPAFIRRVIGSVDFEVSGAGVFDSASANFFEDWALSGAAKNIRVNRNQTGAQGGSYLSCSAVLTSFAVTGAARDTMTANLTLKSAAAVTRTANA